MNKIAAMFNISQIFALIIIVSCVCAESGQEMYRENSVNITSGTMFPGRIIVKEISQPHNLFIGRCTKKYPILHQENVVLNNDGKSQISANIRINVEGRVYIDCVYIYDDDPEVSAYPTYLSGGVGYNFVEFNVLTTSGRGFRFFVQIFGHTLPM